VQLGTNIPSWNIGIFAIVMPAGTSLLSSRKTNRSGLPGEKVCPIVIVEIWPKHVADGPHPSDGPEASDSESDAGVPSCVAGTVAVVTCGLPDVAPVPGSVVRVPPEGGT
jgi:hypothetical protein